MAEPIIAMCDPVGPSSRERVNPWNYLILARHPRESGDPVTLPLIKRFRAARELLSLSPQRK
jgi:hypothetical protein